jgi:hypothetical protein
MHASDWTAKAFVELDRADVGPADPGSGERLVGCLDRGDAEPVRLERGGSATRDPGQRCSIEEIGGSGGSEQHGGGAVVERRRVAGGDRARGPEGRAELGERLDGRVRPDALVAHQVGAGHGDHEVVVEAGLPAGVGELVGSGRELVLARPGDAELLLELFVRLAERDRPLGRHRRVDQTPAQGA